VSRRREPTSGDDRNVNDGPEEYRIDESPPVVGRYGHNGTLKEFKEQLNRVIRERNIKSPGKRWFRNQ